MEKNSLTYLLCDIYSSGIYLVSDNNILANCVQKGILDSYIHPVYSNNFDKQLLKFCDKNIKHYFYNRPNSIVELGIYNTTNQFLENKKLAQLRKPYIQKLIREMSNCIAKENSFIYDSLSLLNLEVNFCNQTNTISNIISDMAEISEFSNDDNYLNHLNLIVSSEKNRRLRLYAIFYKYVDIFNKLSLEEELNVSFSKAKLEFGQNAAI